MNRKQALLLSALTLLCLVLALLVSRRLWFRLDLTGSRAFTIAPVSRNLYAEITGQVRITYFISDRLRAVHPVPGEIEDLLREYAARSHGRITVALKDPVKANMAETVEALGIQGQPLETVDQDQASVSMVYSGILIEYLDASEVLPLVFSLDTLEYDLTGRIRSMVRGTAREAGVLCGDAGRNFSRDFSYLEQTLTQAGYRVRTINPGDAIPQTLSLLIVLGGAAELEEWDLYRIEYFIRNGGNVFFAVEAVNTDSEYTLSARRVEDAGLLAMLSFYGATVEPALALDPSCQTIPVQTQGGGGYTQYQIIRYPFWISALEQFAAKSHPALSGFSGADLFWASPVRLNPPAGVEATALFSTTPDAWLQTGNFYLDPNQSYSFALEQETTKGQKILCAALAGTFPSWFEGQPLPEREGSGEILPPLPAVSVQSRIIVTGDTDIAANNYIQAVRSQRNLNFLIGAMDWLGNDGDISSIRSRDTSKGKLDRIADPDARALRMAQVRLLNVLVIPALVVALGIAVNFRRRKILAAGQKSGRELA